MKIMLLKIKNLIIILCLTFSVPMLGQVQLGNDILGEATYDVFGKVMALSADGRRVASGGPNNDGGGANAGHVRVHEYQTSSSTWLQVGSDIDGVTAGEAAGTSISLSGDGKRLVILSPHYVNAGYLSGQAKVFQESNGAWTQLGNTIVGQSTEQLHYSVSISSDGKRIAIGTKHNKVKVYKETNGFWVQVGATITGGGIFGFSVSLSSDGKRLAVGAPNQNTTNGVGSGEVKIFQENNGTWSPIGAGIIGDVNADQSGYAVALSGDGKRVVIGAPYNSIPVEKGQVRVFGENGGVWTQVGSDIDGENNSDQFGWSVSISSNGKRIIAGSIDNSANGTDAGHARIYQENGNTWTQIGTDIDGTAAQNHAGHSVAISMDGYTVGLGAPAHNNVGQVRVFGIPVPPSCVETKTVTGHYCKRRAHLLEPIRVVNTKEIVLEINTQGTLPSGASCTGSQVSWTHFNIKTESFSSSGAMTTPATQKTLNNIPISDFYNISGSNSLFYHLPLSAVATMLQTLSSSNTYRLRVTLTGVNGNVVSAHSTQYVLNVSPDAAYLCTSVANTIQVPRTKVLKKQ
jgi:WD40 repeat protein